MVNLQTMDVNYGIQTFDSSIRCRDGDPRSAWYFCDARPGAVGYRFSGQAKRKNSMKIQKQTNLRTQRALAVDEALDESAKALAAPDF